MHPVRSSPRFEGLSFALTDLQVAMAWASLRPDLRLLVAMDYIHTPELIEIHLAGSDMPRWVMWRDYTGCLHVDDWAGPEFDLPCPTIMLALRFIESNLANSAGRQTLAP
jgi:hypothetical protein